MAGCAISLTEATIPVGGVDGRSLAPDRLLRAWLGACVGLGLLTLLLLATHPVPSLADFFFETQDVPLLAAEMALLVVCVRLTTRRDGASAMRLPGRAIVMIVAGAAVLTLAVGIVGWRQVMFRYPLSMDEYMASFDATALRHGQLLASVPARWRSFVPSMQPNFSIPTRDHAVWRSDYLPINAAWRALCMAVGDAALSGAVASAMSVLLVFGLARRLWPRRLDAALASAVLLASSSQFLATAMTAYAMPAHLALNCLWLWLYRRDSRRSDAAMLVVGWAACGLHQIVFHLLFVAPFVLELWWRRRSVRGAILTSGYAAIALSWMLFWPVVFHLDGLQAPVGKAGGIVPFATHVADLLRTADLGTSLRLTAENLLRFMAWQNPLTVALLLVGFGAALRSPGMMRNLAAGILLTVLVSAVLMPSQGHGWGYRYLHGLLGSVSLLAAAAYVQLTERGWRPAVAWRALWLSVAGALLILAPWRIVQIRAFVQPYAAAHEAIVRSGADAVVVDGRAVAYGYDLVRNDPDIDRDRPLVFALPALPPQGLAQVCQLGRVDIFDVEDAKHFGIMTSASPSSDPLATALRRRLTAADCASRHVVPVTAHSRESAP